MSASVCVCLCVFVRPRVYLPNCARDLYQFFVHVAYGRGSVFLRRDDEIQGGGAILGFFFPIDNALYSVAFGTHTQTDEPIQMPFWMMTWMDPRYHVLIGGPDPPWEVAIFEGKRSGPL